MRPAPRQTSLLGLALPLVLGTVGCPQGGAADGTSGTTSVTVTVIPAGGATNVATGACITIHFSKPAQPGTANVSISPTLAVSWSWSLDNARLTATPTENLALDTSYTITLNSASFTDGSRLGAAVSARFTMVSQDPSVTSKWALWSDGTRLRGANIWQRTVLPEVYGEGTLGGGAVGPPLIQDDFRRLAALGANVVNISHPGLYTEEPPYELDEDIQSNLDSLLDMIAKADMFAIITFRTGPGRSEFTFSLGEDTTADPDDGWFSASLYNDTVWTDQDAQDAWAAMWRHAANRYQDNDTVVGYDLMCEPNAEEVFFDIWGDPTAFYPAQANTSYDWNQFYPDIITAIREVDSETPVLVQPMGYGAVVWLPYLEQNNDAHIVYTVHQYEPVSYTHQEPTTPGLSYPGSFDADGDSSAENVNYAYLQTILAPLDTFQTATDIIVAVNEFGPVRYAPGAADYADDLIELFENRGMNHVLWEWGTSWSGYIDNDAFSFRHGADPTHHADVAQSDLLDVIIKYWRRNTLRPSAVTFE